MPVVRNPDALKNCGRVTIDVPFGAAIRKLVAKFSTFCCSGRSPVRNDDRDGEHTAICTYACWNSVPVAASRSIAGLATVSL